jgi:hypothetical protein
MSLDDYLRLLSATNHKCLYHFTDRRNLPSISNVGLLSMRQMRERGLVPAVTGGNEWSLTADVGCGMDAYVHLCLLAEHPMEWRAREDNRIRDSIFLRINPEIMRRAGVMITNQVSNKSGVVPQTPDEILGNLDLEVIYGRTDWKLPEIRERRNSAKLYEILIPDEIPIDMILNING